MKCTHKRKRYTSSQDLNTRGPLGCVLEQGTPTPAHMGAAQWRPAVAFVKLFDANEVVRVIVCLFVCTLHYYLNTSICNNAIVLQISLLGSVKINFPFFKTLV